MKLCEHTRELLYELNAAGKTTNDLLANLIEALQEAPDSNFQRWLSNQVDLWSMRKLDCKQDGSDLMEEAEIYYQEATNTHRWGKKAYRHDIQYAFKATNYETETETEKETEKPLVSSYEEMIKALTAQLQEQTNSSLHCKVEWSNLKLSTRHGQEICMAESATKEWGTINKENVLRWKTQNLPLVPTS